MPRAPLIHHILFRATEQQPKGLGWRSAPFLCPPPSIRATDNEQGRLVAWREGRGLDTMAWSNSISILLGLTESLCQRDDFSCHTMSLKKRKKINAVSWFFLKKLITIYKCGCAFSTALEIFKCPPDVNTRIKCSLHCFWISGNLS